MLVVNRTSICVCYTIYNMKRYSLNINLDFISHDKFSRKTVLSSAVKNTTCKLYRVKICRLECAMISLRPTQLPSCIKWSTEASRWGVFNTGFEMPTVWILHAVWLQQHTVWYLIMNEILGTHQSGYSFR